MKKIASWVMLCALGSAICLFTPHRADARTQYLKAFNEKYEGIEGVKTKAGELKCGVCHGEGGKNKKVVSDYAKALGEALGAKNVKDAEKIGEALTTIEAKKDAGSEKTYGEVLKSGELPKAAE